MALVLGLTSLAWAVLILLADGPDFRVGSLRIRSNDPMRPLLVAALAMSVCQLAGGTIPLQRRVPPLARRPR